MKKIEELMGKWWFRIALIAAVALVMFVLAMCFMPKDTGDVHYANDGAFTIVSILAVYLAIVLMYVATDIMDDMRFKIGKALRMIIFIGSLALVVLALLIGVISYIIAVGGGKEIQPVFDGLGIAPIITYVMLYFFVVGRFEKTENSEPDRKKQFILTVVSLVAPIIVGIVLALILKLINNSTISLIILSALVVIAVGSFVLSYKRYGFLLGGMKEFDREKPEYSDSDFDPGQYGEWEAKFMTTINNEVRDMYTSVNVYAYLVDGCVHVDVKIDYYGSNDAEIQASHRSELGEKARSAYASVAKACPYSSKLNIQFV